MRENRPNMTRPEFDLLEWYRAFLRWLQQPERTAELVEILSDCSSELFLNALTARHMRLYGREHGIARLWARCEWAKTDISFGVATQAFQAWDDAWQRQESGDIGQIEAKLVYDGYHPSKRRAMARTLGDELHKRREDDRKEGRQDQRYLGLVWFYRYTYHGEDWRAGITKAGSDASWSKFFDKAGLKAPVSPPGLEPEYGHFFAAGEQDLTPVWPLDHEVHGALGVTLREVEPEA